MTNPALIHFWEHDPGVGDSPLGGSLLTGPVPDLSRPPYAMEIRVIGGPPPADQYGVETAAFRFWAASEALSRMANLWTTVLPNGHWHPAIGAVLPVRLDDGDALNAFYDRESLSFFHRKVGKRTIYSGESPDILCHEAGHAALDGVRPQLFDAASLEVQAFHEAFADVIGLSCALEVPSLRKAVLEETEGRLFRPSRMSRLAEQLGWAIRQFAPDAVDPDCLRNAVNSFFYAPPDKLPPEESASKLSSEPHSFSRVFTAAYLRALAGAFDGVATHTEADLQSTSRQLLTLLVRAIKRAPVVPEYFSQVAAHFVHEAALAQSPFTEAVKLAMVSRGLLSVTGSVTVTTTTPAVGIVALSGKTLPVHDLDVSAYGLAVPTIKVQTASQPKAFGVAGASTALGDVGSVSGQDAARTFVDDLIRRGRLDFGKFAVPGTSLVNPGSMKTHELTEQGSDMLLKRIRIDCIPRRKA